MISGGASYIGVKGENFALGDNSLGACGSVNIFQFGEGEKKGSKKMMRRKHVVKNSLTCLFLKNEILAARPNGTKRLSLVISLLIPPTHSRATDTRHASHPR